eukprot:TRINITY_DN65690_c0_g1_i1.p1 TRINITY_DN65690_c0_g1~~TRINITY_DN65690_c0_g1_i1.p1  ORF type:complete len:324 (+),score=75.16 TRINITY_DN65690_c0_g1_i1:53-1024(+)
MTQGHQRTCRTCRKGEYIIDSDAGCIYCEACGAVAKTMVLDDSPEWDIMEDGALNLNAQRCSIATGVERLLHDKEGTDSKSSRLRGLGAVRQRKIDRSNNLILQGSRDLNFIGTQFGLPEIVVTKASECYAEFIKLGIFPKRSCDNLIHKCCAIYLGSRMAEDCRSIKEITTMFGLKKMEFTKLLKVIHLKAPRLFTAKMKFSLTVMRTCRRLRLDEIVNSCAMDICNEIQERALLAGRVPENIISCSILVACTLLSAKPDPIRFKKLVPMNDNVLRSVQAIAGYLSDIVPEYAISAVTAKSPKWNLPLFAKRLEVICSRIKK